MNGLLVRKLLRDLWHGKGALATVLATMAVGVSAYVGIAGVWRDLDGARATYYRSGRLADFTVDLERVPEWAIEQARSLPNVRSLRGRVTQAVLVNLPSARYPIPGTAISMPEVRRPVLNDLRLLSGGWFSARDDREVILNDAFAAAHGLVPGSRIKVRLLDRQHDLLVVGTAMSPEFVYLIPADGGLAPDPARFAVLYLGERFLREASNLEGAFNQIIGRTHRRDGTAIANLLSLIAETLDPFGVAQTTTGDDQPSVRFLKDELRGLEVQSRVMPAIFLVVAALVLNIVMSRLVEQQRTVIGTLRAVGYPRRAITGHYLSYGLAIGVAGGLAGVLLGGWLQSGMLDVYRQFYALPGLSRHVYPDIVVAAVGISVGFAVIGTLKGVIRAIRLEPADAMRPAHPQKGSVVWLERAGPAWRALGLRSRMAVRALFRNPLRSVVSLVVAAVATSLVLATLSLSDSLDYLMNYEFERVAQHDVSVTIRDPKGMPAANELRRLAGVSGIEPELTVTSDLRNGSYAKRIGITGLASGNRLHTPLDRAGNPIVIPEAGLVLSAKLAQILHLREGDKLSVRPLTGRRTAAVAIVAGTVDTYLGLSAYTDIDYLSRLLGEEPVANVLLAKTEAGGIRGPMLDALERRGTVVGLSERTRALEQLEGTFGETMGIMIATMIGLAGMIAFGAVLNAAVVSLSERRREVGTFRVLGYSTAHVASLFARESFLVSGAGVAVGLWGGVGLAYALAGLYSTELYRFPAVIRPGSIALSAVLMLAFVALAQLVVWGLVRRLDWLSVLNVKE